MTNRISKYYDPLPPNSLPPNAIENDPEWLDDSYSVLGNTPHDDSQRTIIVIGGVFLFALVMYALVTCDPVKIDGEWWPAWNPLRWLP